MNENGHSPVTKADLESALASLFKQVVSYVDGRFQEVDGRLQQLREHVDERIYDTETRLLRAFNEFATAQDVRLCNWKRISGISIPPPL